MKKPYIFLILLFMVGAAFAQTEQPCESCLPEGIHFNTQAQIDSFQINYPNCAEIEGDVYIRGMDINNLNGLSILTSIDGVLMIAGNSLTSLTGLDNLNYVGSDLYIGYGDAIITLSNPLLSSLTGLEGLSSIGGSLVICYNDTLTSLVGLGEVMTIGVRLDIVSNASLTSLIGLEGVSSIAFQLVIQNNPALIGLTGLDNVTFIGGPCWIEDNVALTSLAGLENVTSIGGSCWIKHNNSLSGLTELQSLTSIGRDLQISDNPGLTSLMGLEKIDASSIEDLYIFDNVSLSTCEVQSICDYLSAPNGTVEIYDNAIGCNSPEEVLDSCEANGVAINEEHIIEECKISPNPFNTSTTLSFRLYKPENVHFTVYNVQSQIVYTIEEWREKGEQKLEWNADGLPAGMYYYRIVAGDRTGSGKLVVGDW